MKYILSLILYFIYILYFLTKFLIFTIGITTVFLWNLRLPKGYFNTIWYDTFGLYSLSFYFNPFTVVRHINKKLDDSLNIINETRKAERKEMEDDYHSEYMP